MAKQKSTIGSLETGTYHPVYRRADGTAWLKLSESAHAPARREGHHWIGNGFAQDLAPDEEVEVLHTASECLA